MDKQELISVIIPTYNRAHLLPRAIESVLRQTYQNIELIIVDDFSEDNTDAIIKDYIKNDKRIIYFKNKKNEGAASSRNAGIEYCRGNFLMFLDDDCEYLPDKIEKEMTLMSQLSPSPAIIYSNMYVEKKEAALIYPKSKKSKFITAEDIFNCRYNPLEPSTWFCRSDRIRKIGGFYKGSYNYDDIDLLTRAILGGERLYFLNIPLGIKHRVNGISTLSYKSISAKEIFLEKNFSKLKKYKKYISRFYYVLGKDFSKIGDFKKAKKYFWQAFLFWPFSIGYLFKIIRVDMKMGAYGYAVLKRNSELKNNTKSEN